MSSLLSGAAGVFGADEQERRDFVGRAVSAGLPFALPDAVDRLAAVDVLDAVCRVSQERHVPVYRVADGYSVAGAPQTVLYVEGAPASSVVTSAGLEQGTRPAADGEDFTLATSAAHRRDVTGVLPDLLGNDSRAIVPLARIQADLPTAGTYYVETRDPARAGALRAALAESLSRLGAGEVTAKDLFVPPIPPTPMSGGMAPFLIFLAYASVVLVVVAVGYQQMYESRRIGIWRLHGWGLVRVWWVGAARPLLGVWMAATALSAAGSLLLPGAHGALARQVIDSLVPTGLAMVGGSLVAMSICGPTLRPIRQRWMLTRAACRSTPSATPAPGSKWAEYAQLIHDGVTIKVRADY